MAQSKTGSALDKDVAELHEQLVAVLGGGREDEGPRKAYWDTSSTDLEDYFDDRVAELLKSFADQPATSPGTDGQAATKPTGS